MFGHSKVLTEFLFLETGTIPVQYVISCRRMIYLQTILKRSPDELTRLIYEAQKVDSVAGDYCKLVYEDFNNMNIHITEDHIVSMGGSYKLFIKEKVKKAAFVYLSQKQKEHSKIKEILYEDLKVQPYLVSPIFSKHEISTLFSLRSRTLRGMRMDFK